MTIDFSQIHSADEIEERERILAEENAKGEKTVIFSVGEKGTDLIKRVMRAWNIPTEEKGEGVCLVYESPERITQLFTVFEVKENKLSFWRKS